MRIHRSCLVAREYVDRFERFELYPFAIDAIRLFKQAGYLVVILTNQAGVAHGIYGEDWVATLAGYLAERAEEVERLDERMNGHLRRLRMMAMLAARSPEDAEGMAGVLCRCMTYYRVQAAIKLASRMITGRAGDDAAAIGPSDPPKD